MFFATRNIKEVEEFWLIYFTMTTTLKDYIPDCDEFRIEFRDIMEGQFEQNFQKKNLSVVRRDSVIQLL